LLADWSTLQLDCGMVSLSEGVTLSKTLSKFDGSI